MNTMAFSLTGHLCLLQPQNQQLVALLYANGSASLHCSANCSGADGAGVQVDSGAGNWHTVPPSATVALDAGWSLAVSGKP